MRHALPMAHRHTHRDRSNFEARMSFFARWDDSTQNQLIATGHGVPPRTTTHWRSRRLPPLGAPATLSRIVLDGQHGVQRLACRVVFISSPPRRHFEYILAFKVCYTPANECTARCHATVLARSRGGSFRCFRREGSVRSDTKHLWAHQRRQLHHSHR